MSARPLVVVVSLLAAIGCAGGSGGSTPGANALDFPNGYPSPETSAALRDELLYTRAVQAYLWALPVISWYGMKEASEAEFGAGYHVLPIWKSRLDARTKVTTPNSDVIYAMGYLDLKDGPLVIEVVDTQNDRGAVLLDHAEVHHPDLAAAASGHQPVFSSSS